jgi:hypothetical protein
MICQTHDFCERQDVLHMTSIDCYNVTCQIAKMTQWLQSEAVWRNHIMCSTTAVLLLRQPCAQIIKWCQVAQKSLPRRHTQAATPHRAVQGHLNIHIFAWDAKQDRIHVCLYM